MKKYILLILVFCSSPFVDAGTVNSINTNILGSILGDTTFMKTVEASLETKMSETMSLKSISFEAMSSEGGSSGKAQYQFLLHYDNMFFTDFIPPKQCVVLVTYTVLKNESSSTKAFDTNCQIKEQGFF